MSPASPALVQHRNRSRHRARDWARFQERMLVPLYERAFDRMEVGPGSRVLGLGCGSGLALLTAASRGAGVLGVESDAELIGLARERLLCGGDTSGAPSREARLVHGEADDLPADTMPPNLVTAFDALPSSGALARATDAVAPGTPVVLAGWGPPERCAAAPALRAAAGDRAAPGRDDLEEVALRSGLRLEGSGRVSCPFRYPDPATAVRGLLAHAASDGGERTARAVDEAIRPYVHRDGTVVLPNLFRYVVARTVRASRAGSTPRR